MPEINQLNTVNTLSAGDLLPVFVQMNGDARAASVSTLASYMQTQVTGKGGFITQYFAPSASGFTVLTRPVTEGGGVWLLMTPNATYAAGTIQLPLSSTAFDGQEILVTSTQEVTALTVDGNGASVNGAPTTIEQNDFFRLRFDGVFKNWYRVG